MSAHTSRTTIGSVRGVRVEYPDFVLGPVDFDLRSGETTTLMGPNGSGKTTLLHSMLGLREASGRTELDGGRLDARDPFTLARLGYASDSPDDLLPELDALEFWHFCALTRQRYGERIDRSVTRARELAAEFDLTDLRTPLRALSLGTRRKVQLCAAFMHEPDLVLLDEPLTGLDFFASRALERIITDSRERGASILLASHNLEVANRTSDRVLLLHLGRLVADDPVTSLRVDGDLVVGVEDALERSRDRST